MATKHPDLESQEITLRRTAASLKSAQEDFDYAQDVFVDAAHKALHAASEHQARTTGLHLPQIRDALCEHVNADRCKWAKNPILVLGSGPWEQREFSRFLSEKGFVVATHEDDVGTLVLGSHGFDKDELMDLLRALDDRTSIFTQELLVCGLVREKSPYEMLQQSREILALHPAVAVILKSGRQWPALPDMSEEEADDDVDETFGSQPNEDVREVDATFAGKDSPLNQFGYSASPNGPHDWSRHRILDEVFGAVTLRGLTDEEQRYWGASGSAVRLQAICNALPSFAGFSGRETPAARAKVVADLEWLRSRYYRPTMGFEWPSVASRTAIKQILNAPLTRSVKPDDVLSAVVGSESCSRNEILAKLWAYIKTHQLQDSKSKKMINADDKLREFFGKDQVSMYQLANLISRHVR